MDDLFERIVRRIELPSASAAGALRRSLADIGAAATSATRTDYLRALAKLRPRLRAHLPPEATERCLGDLSRFLSSHAP